MVSQYRFLDLQHDLGTGHLQRGEGPTSIPCGPRLGPSWAKLGPKWAPDGPDWGPFGNAACGGQKGFFSMLKGGTKGFEVVLTQGTQVLAIERGEQKVSDLRFPHFVPPLPLQLLWLIMYITRRTISEVQSRQTSGNALDNFL